MNENINNLVDKYIKDDDTKKLWELAFEYKNEIDLKKIVYYYIEVRDSFNVCELISIVSEYLDLDDIFNSIIETKDKTFMFNILNNGPIKSIIDCKYFLQLEKACNEQI